MNEAGARWIGLGLVAVAVGVGYFAVKMAETTAQLERANRSLAPAAENVASITDPLADIFRGVFGDDPSDKTGADAPG